MEVGGEKLRLEERIKGFQKKNERGEILLSENMG